MHGADTRSQPRNLAFAAILGAQRMAVFPLQLLYARALSPDDFGTIAVLITVASIAGFVFTLGLEGPTLRGLAAYASDPLQRSAHLRAVLGVLAIATPALLAAAVAVAIVFSAVSGHALPGLVLVDLIAVATTVAVTTVPLMVYRVEQRIGAFATTIGAVAAGQVVCRAAFLLAGDPSATGWVAADVVAAIAAVVAVRACFRPGDSPLPRAPHTVAALRVGLPLLPNMAGQWALAAADRFVVDRYAGRAALGVYQAGCAVPAAFGGLAAEINRAVMPAYARVSGRDDAAQRAALGRTMSAQIVLLAAGGLLAAAASRIVVLTLLPDTYARAADIGPVVALAYVCFGLYQIPMNLLTIVEGRTTWVWAITWSAVTLGLVIDVVALRPGDAMPAAVATLVSYLALLAGVTAHYRKVRTTPALPDGNAWWHWAAARVLVLALGGVVLAGGAFVGGSADAIGLALASAIAMVVPWGADGALMRLHRAGDVDMLAEAAR